MLPLEGVRVLDISQMWAVPGAGMYLADQGADVIKVEPPWGDSGRLTYTTAPIGDINRHFLVLNRNKRDVVVDISKEAGREVIYKLVEKSDVLLQNYRPGVAERIGMGYETLQRLNPRLVYVAVTPYGNKGPYAGSRAYDLLVQSHSGILGHRSMPDGTPISGGVWVADCSAPMLIAYGVMLALWVREKTGKGQKVETSLLNLGVAMQSVDMVRAESELQPKASGVSQPRSLAAQALYAPYRCQDGAFIMLVVVTDDEWSRLCRVLGLEHLTDDPAFKTSLSRAENSTELFPILEGVFATRPRDEWVKALLLEDVPCAPVMGREEVFKHPQLLANDMLIDVEQPPIGKVRMMGIPVKLCGNPGQIRRPAPGFGQHTEEVLLELGYTSHKVEELRQQGVVK